MYQAYQLLRSLRLCHGSSTACRNPAGKLDTPGPCRRKKVIDSSTLTTESLAMPAY
ncbi:MAG: hypothetical protein RLZZ206_3410 [Cyanobacteriota bacterium]|jgi:hypothetical protein